MRPGSLLALVAVWIALAALAAAAVGQAPADAGPFETPPVLRLEGVKPEVAPLGLYYRIADEVYNDGFYNRYALSTTFGPLVAEGDDLLALRLYELDAIRRMDGARRSDVYQRALESSAKAPFKAVKSLLTRPVQTLAGVPLGVGRYVGSLGHAVFARKAGEDEGLIKTAIGFDGYKRRLAHFFGVDPYSSYEPLQNALNDVSWAGFAGGLGLDSLLGTVPQASAPPGWSGYSREVRDLLRDKDASELRRLTGERLDRMGVDGATAGALLGSSQYSPSEATGLVAALERMAGVGGREVFVVEAARAPTETLAFYTRRRAALAAAYHRQVTPVARFVSLAGLSFLQRSDGTVVGIFPVDYACWTEGLAEVDRAVARELEALPGVTGKEIWLAGAASPAARKRLEASGWRVEEDAGEALALR